MKKLIIYYSFEGNVEFVAKTMADLIQADVLVLKPKDQSKREGFMKYVWGGKQVLMKVTPDLESLNLDPTKYDFLLIGTPVWAFSFAPALRSFFEKVPFTGKKVALFCCHEGMPGNTFKNMAKVLAGNQIVGQMDFYAPLKSEKERICSKIQLWLKQMDLLS